MTKRRLNQHQQRRISGNQDAHKERNVRDDSPANPEAETTEGISLDGLIVCHYGKQIDVESLAPEHKGEVFRCFQRSNLPAMVTGDKVLWQIEEGQSGVIIALQPRHSSMSRPNHRGELRAIAANVDCVVVVIAPKPEPFGNLIDRYMVAIEHLGLRPLLLLNKSDLTTTKGTIDVEALLKRYARIGYETLRVSSHTGYGMEELKQALAGHTAVFVGQSGVGKSSLINTLRGLEAGDKEVAEVGDLSVSHHKGTHTTTATRLYHLPGSGDLIDSPGIREFGLWHIESDALMDGFVEFRPLTGQCRFRDCRHKHEPDCALLAAVKRGEIDEIRLESYHHILASLEQKG